jgi:hypothetical protein
VFGFLFKGAIVMSKVMKLFCGVGAVALFFVAGSAFASYAISLNDPSFETPIQPDGDGSTTAYWLSSTPGNDVNHGGGNGFNVNPNDASYAGTTDTELGVPANANGVIPDGGQVGTVVVGNGYDRRLNQVTGDTVVDGRTYTLSFYAGHALDEAAPFEFSGVTAKLVDGSGNVIGTQDFTTDPGAGAFSLCTLTATATSAHSGLLGVQFFADGAPTYTYGQVNIDKVSLTATPEPSTIVLAASGLIGLLCYAWKKRK